MFEFGMRLSRPKRKDTNTLKTVPKEDSFFIFLPWGRGDRADGNADHRGRKRHTGGGVAVVGRNTKPY